MADPSWRDEPALASSAAIALESRCSVLPPPCDEDLDFRDDLPPFDLALDGLDLAELVFAVLASDFARSMEGVINSSSQFPSDPDLDIGFKGPTSTQVTLSVIKLIM